MSETSPQIETPPDNVIKLPARTKAQKAAAILALLDDDSLTALAGRLSEDHRDRLIDAVSSLQSVSTEEQKRIAQEFATQFAQERNSLRGSEEHANRLGKLLFHDPNAVPQLEMDPSLNEEEEGEVPETLWDRVAKLPPKDITAFLADKPMVVASIAMRCLPPDAASEVAGILPEEMTRDGLIQIAAGGKPNPLAVEAVEQLFNHGLLAKSNDDEDGSGDGPSSGSSDMIANILNRLTATRREMVLEALHSQLSQDEAADIASKVLSFDSLEERLPRNAIPILFREIEETELLTALKFTLSQGKPIADYLLANISQRMAAQYKEKMETMPVSEEEEGEKSQSRVICKILEMSDSGKITLLES
ncbi:MAG: FliG C-terminal domain-containing protein [Pseudomonadota bacterium]